MPETYAQEKENGVINEVVGINKIQFYVSDVKELNTSGSRSVEISVVFKNLGRSDQEFYPNTLRLVDSQSREYESEYMWFVSFMRVPPEDTLAFKASFKILSNNLSKIYYEPYYPLEGRLTVDLTKKMTPPEDPPRSSWTLSFNKGIKMSSKQLEITINDERFEGKKYIIDTTLKNIGNTSLPYDRSYFRVKDESGFPYSRNILPDSQSPLLSGKLPPGEQVRGDVEFDDVSEPGKKMMILYSPFTGPSLNSGSLSIQNTHKLP